jgi:two-component system, NarL family, response regulator LiaR
LEPIRILIADDHAIVREGLRTLISSQAHMTIVGEAADGLEVVRKARLLKPDIILMDLVMPLLDGIEAIRQIKKEQPEMPILVITSFADDDKVFPAIKVGALGYLLKDSSPQQLLQAIVDVQQGKSSLHPSIALKLIHELNQPSPLPLSAHPLTDREVDVLKLVAQGLSDTDIADNLTISEWTVRTHMRNILGKLHLANRTQAALYALSEGIARLKPPNT